jgi:hypothetical protein
MDDDRHDAEQAAVNWRRPGGAAVSAVPQTEVYRRLSGTRGEALVVRLKESVEHWRHVGNVGADADARLSLPRSTYQDLVVFVWLAARAAYLTHNTMHTARLGASLWQSLRADFAQRPLHRSCAHLRAYYLQCLPFTTEALRAAGWMAVDVAQTEGDAWQLSVPSLNYAALVGGRFSVFPPPPELLLPVHRLDDVLEHTFAACWQYQLGRFQALRPRPPPAGAERWLLAALKAYFNVQMAAYVRRDLRPVSPGADAGMPPTWQLDLADVSLAAASRAPVLASDARTVIERMPYSDEAKQQAAGMLAVLPPCMRALTEPETVNTYGKSVRRRVWANYIASVGAGVYTNQTTLNDAHYALWSLPYVRDTKYNPSGDPAVPVTSSVLLSALSGELLAPPYSCARVQHERLCPFVADIEDTPGRKCAKCLPPSAPTTTITSPSMYTYLSSKFM